MCCLDKIEIIMDLYLKAQGRTPTSQMQFANPTRRQMGNPSIKGKAPSWV